MKGTNPIAGRRTEGEGLLVHSMWHTLQGEGPFAGIPAVFVRLAGCNLQCAFCDTDFSGGEAMSALELEMRIGDILYVKHETRLVVITGGEPMLQPLTGIVHRLLKDGASVQIETAGTAWPDGFDAFLEGGVFIPDVTVVCSPKTPKLHKDFKYSCLKYIVQMSHLLEDGIPQGVYKPRPNDEVFLQPCDEGEGRERDTNFNTIMAAQACMRYGHRLSIQLHKIVGLE